MFTGHVDYPNSLCDDWSYSRCTESLCDLDLV